MEVVIAGTGPCVATSGPGGDAALIEAADEWDSAEEERTLPSNRGFQVGRLLVSVVAASGPCGDAALIEAADEWDSAEEE